MKRVSTVLTAAALAAMAGLSAVAAPARILPAGGIDMDAKAKDFKFVTPDAFSATRTAEVPVTEFTADRAVFWSYGDLYGNGTGVYYLFLANMDFSQTMPLDKGQMARYALVGEPTDPENPQLPAGTYTLYTQSDELPVAGTFVPESSDCLDVFENPDNPGSGELVAYQFTPISGTVTVTKEGDTYSISIDGMGGLFNDEEEMTYSQEIKVSYTGAVTFEDHTAYKPLGEDYEMNLPNASGRVTDGGNWSIAFYDVPLDEEGFIIGSGELFNVELFTKEVSDGMNGDDLIGTYGPCDLFETGGEPGCYGQGVWYEFYGMYMAIGTNLTIYDKNANVDKTGLAEAGAITISREGDVYTVKADLITAKGEKLTGTYTGKLLDYITDMTTTGVSQIKTDGNKVFGGKGCVICPEGAEVYDIAGKRVGVSGLNAGVYVVRHNGESTKVAVK